MRAHLSVPVPKCHRNVRGYSVSARSLTVSVQSWMGRKSNSTFSCNLPAANACKRFRSMPWTCCWFDWFVGKIIQDHRPALRGYQKPQGEVEPIWAQQHLLKSYNQQRHLFQWFSQTQGPPPQLRKSILWRLLLQFQSSHPPKPPTSESCRIENSHWPRSAGSSAPEKFPTRCSLRRPWRPGGSLRESAAAVSCSSERLGLRWKSTSWEGQPEGRWTVVTDYELGHWDGHWAMASYIQVSTVHLDNPYKPHNICSDISIYCMIFRDIPW